MEPNEGGHALPEPIEGVDPAQRALADARVDALLDAAPPARTNAVDFLGRQFDAGLAWVQFPPGHGGMDLPEAVQGVVDARLAAASAPSAFRRNPLGVGMCAPTVRAHGQPEQQRRLLRPLFSGEEIWCQLFSEPGAGSDLAGVATRARPDGHAWILDGQKVWTSYAHQAAWGLLLARTDPDVPKHAGLTAFVVDMCAPGIEIRPLQQMTGDAVFNEVYLTGVRIPDTYRLGPIGAGWSVVMTTLASERAALGASCGGRTLIDVAMELWSRGGGGAVAQDRLMQLWSRSEVLKHLNRRLQQERFGPRPGPEGTMTKVLAAELNQDITELSITLLGGSALLKVDGYTRARSTRDPFAVGDVVHDFLRAQANTIEGGTSDIGRTVLAERVLGLPPEPRSDRSTPWSQVPR